MDVTDEQLDTGLAAAVGYGSPTALRAVVTDALDLPLLRDSVLDGAGEAPVRQLRDGSIGCGSIGTRGALVDTMALALAMVLVAAGEAAAGGHGDSVGAVFATLARLVVCLPVLALALGRSRRRLFRSLNATVGQQVKDVALPLAAGTLACIAGWRVLTSLTSAPAFPENELLLSVGAGVLTVALARVERRAPGRLRGERGLRILLVGSGAVADRIARQLEATRSGHVVGYVDDDPKDPSGCLGSLDQLAAVCDRRSVDHVVVAFSRAQAEDIVEALRPIQGRLPISVVPRLFDVLPSSADAHHLVSGYPAISVAPSISGSWRRVTKRAIDIIGSAVVLIVGLPVLLIVAIAVRVSSRGPIFLRQVRVGRDGRKFKMWKFRTLTVSESVPPPEVLASGEQVTGPFPKPKSDPRTTPVGRVLRRWSVDELPQLLNVLLGSMSLVGPRPLAPEYAWNFGPWALRRYDVKPGVTGLWQVSGRNDLTYDEMCRLDDLYVTSWSPGLDAEILVRTVRAVVGGRGCY